MESLTEVAGAGVTHLHGCFRDVVFTGPKQLGCFVHAKLAQALGDGLARVVRKNAAQIEVAATNLSAEIFQRRRRGEVFLEQPHDLFHTLFRLSSLPCAEKLGIFGGFQKECRGQFNGLALIPD